MINQKIFKCKYAEIDEDIRDTIWVMNCIPQIQTRYSCIGHGKTAATILFYTTMDTNELNNFIENIKLNEDSNIFRSIIINNLMHPTIKTKVTININSKYHTDYNKTLNYMYDFCKNIINYCTKTNLVDFSKEYDLDKINHHFLPSDKILQLIKSLGE